MVPTGLRNRTSVRRPTETEVESSVDICEMTYGAVGESS